VCCVVLLCCVALRLRCVVLCVFVLFVLFCVVCVCLLMLICVCMCLSFVCCLCLFCLCVECVRSDLCVYTFALMSQFSPHYARVLSLQAVMEAEDGKKIILQDPADSYSPLDFFSLDIEPPVPQYTLAGNLHYDSETNTVTILGPVLDKANMYLVNLCFSEVRPYFRDYRKGFHK